MGTGADHHLRLPGQGACKYPTTDPAQALQQLSARNDLLRQTQTCNQGTRRGSVKPRGVPAGLPYLRTTGQLFTLLQDPVQSGALTNIGMLDHIFCSEPDST
ncbi:MAG: hypothetical protein DRQ54_09625 [Gammaproteobacteria bacterium]|nr:MAG: hypothetical protein DRQ54_09625 [Gammaproteobacteria bacterium]RLA11027.1 MAG: hypothetical protein DRQ52_10375 [Gammaproteobacteria bacterium]